MRKTALTLTLTGLVGFAAACSTASTQTPATNSNTSKSQVNTNTPPTVVSGHSSGGTMPETPATATPATASKNGAAPAAASDEETSAIPKPLQDKVKQAEAKANAANASSADKIAAANALVERGNVFYEAGQPRFYKYALRDFRMAARFNPANAEAAGKRDQIIQIYQSMGRPVPTLGDQP